MYNQTKNKYCRRQSHRQSQRQSHRQSHRLYTTSHQAGFTLVELVIAMTLTVILTGMAGVAGYNYVRYSKTIELESTYQVNAQNVYTTLSNFVEGANKTGSSLTLVLEQASDTDTTIMDYTLKYKDNTDTYTLSEYILNTMSEASLELVSYKTLLFSFIYQEQTYHYYFTSINTINTETTIHNSQGE